MVLGVAWRDMGGACSESVFADFGEQSRKVFRTVRNFVLRLV